MVVQRPPGSLSMQDPRCRSLRISGTCDAVLVRGHKEVAHWNLAECSGGGDDNLV